MSSSKISVRTRILSRLFSDENLTKKASLNAIASALDYGSRLIVGFIIQPILVTGLGDYFYGIWQILIRMMGYITPAGGRPAQALKMTLANQQIVADDEKKRRFVGSALIVWVLFLPLMTILGGILTWYIPYWIKSPVENYWIIRIAAGVLVFNLIVSNVATVPESALEGENLGYKRMGLSAFLVFVGGGLTWLAVWLNTGIIGVGVATLIVTLLTGGFYAWVMRDYAPWFGVARPSIKDVREFLGLSWWFLAWNLIMNLMTASDVVILGILLSVQTVTDYSLSKYAPETLINVIAIMVFGIAPGLGGIIGSGKLEKAARLRGEIMTLTWLIVTVLGSMVLLWNRAFISLWVGSSHFVGSLPDLLIVLVVMQFILIRNDGNVIDLSLRLQQKVIVGIISVGFSLGMAIILIHYLNLGIVGLCLGLIVGRAILSLGYPYLVGRLLEEPLPKQLRSAFRPFVITAILFSIATCFDYYLIRTNSLPVNHWLSFGLGVIVTFFIVLAFAAIFGLTRRQRENILLRIKIVLNVAS